MRALVAITFLLGCTIPAAVAAQSPWRLLGNEIVVLKKTCIDANQVEETSAGVTAWLKDQYAAMQHLPGGPDFDVATAEILVDCSARRWKMIRAVAYDRAGQAIFDDSSSTADFQSIAPGSVGSDFARAACGLARLKRQWAAVNASS